jgi:hypothetical protein
MRDWALQMRGQGDRAPALLYQPSMVLGRVHYHGATIGMAERIRGSQNQVITNVPAASKPRRFTWPVPLSHTFGTAPVRVQLRIAGDLRRHQLRVGGPQWRLLHSSATWTLESVREASQGSTQSSQ